MPLHPTVALGYPSQGDAKDTVPVPDPDGLSGFKGAAGDVKWVDGEWTGDKSIWLDYGNERKGRFVGLVNKDGSTKTECGIHVAGAEKTFDRDLWDADSKVRTRRHKTLGSCAAYTARRAQGGGAGGGVVRDSGRSREQRHPPHPAHRSRWRLPPKCGSEAIRPVVGWVSRDGVASCRVVRPRAESLSLGCGGVWRTAPPSFFFARTHSRGRSCDVPSLSASRRPASCLSCTAPPRRSRFTRRMEQNATMQHPPTPHQLARPHTPN